MAELGENSKFVYMTEQELKDIITEAAAEGARIAIADRDRKNEAEVKRQNDQRLYNMQKLLQNYRHIRSNFLETISNGAQAREQTQEEAIRRLMEGKDDVDVAALETTKTRSGIIIADVDKMMKVFRNTHTRNYMIWMISSILISTVNIPTFWKTRSPLSEWISTKRKRWV